MTFIRQTEREANIWRKTEIDRRRKTDRDRQRQTNRDRHRDEPLYAVDIFREMTSLSGIKVGI